MVDLSRLSSPGWQRLVAQLAAAAPDEATYLMRLTAALGQVAAARQAALHLVEPPPADAGSSAEAQARVVLLWPGPSGTGATELELANERTSAAIAAGTAGQLRVFGLDREDGLYDGRHEGYVVAVPLSAEQPGPRYVVTLAIDGRSQAALQTTLALVEVLAGYTVTHRLRQQLTRSREATAALELAGRLIASLNAAPSFRGAALQVCNDLVRQLAADRVALGWARSTRSGEAIRVIAVSDTEHLDRRLRMIQAMESAMEECLDQAQAVLFPQPPATGPEADSLLATAITHAHRELVAGDARLKVASLPLRVDDRVVGVLTVEVGGEGRLDVETVERLQATLDLIAPVLHVRRLADRSLAGHAWAAARRAGSWAVGPRHTGWKLAGLALAALVVALVVVHVPYRVEAPAVLEPTTRRVIAAPYDGRLVRLGEGIEPGAAVTAGQLLVQLDTAERELQASEARAAIFQARTEAQAAFQAGKLAERDQAEARARAAEAQLALLEHYIAEARIVAPIDGTIVAGDLRDRIGATVRLGDPLLEIAPLDQTTVIARVSDRDIKLIQDRLDRGETVRGQIVTKAFPARPFDVVVERVIPLAQPERGVNAFEVRARLEQVAPWFRPGMEAIARLDTGRRSLLDIGTRRIRETLRLWLWW